eukprot:704327-Amorphochlora_amoeboformis.AAC.1
MAGLHTASHTCHTSEDSAWHARSRKPAFGTAAVARRSMLGMLEFNPVRLKDDDVSRTCSAGEGERIIRSRSTDQPELSLPGDGTGVVTPALYVTRS